MFGMRLLPWEYGVRNLFRRPSRTLLTLAGLTLVVLLVLIFVYAFFKFSWAIRQLGFCSTLIGALVVSQRARSGESWCRCTTSSRPGADSGSAWSPRASSTPIGPPAPRPGTLRPGFCWCGKPAGW